jgi:adenosylcobinamide-GDP ribazoletransferase
VSVVLLGWDGAIAVGVAAVVAVAAGVFFRSWLGGVTGDTLGAATQLAEVAVLVTLVGLR